MCVSQSKCGMASHLPLSCCRLQELTKLVSVASSFVSIFSAQRQRMHLSRPRTTETASIGGLSQRQKSYDRRRCVLSRRKLPEVSCLSLASLKGSLVCFNPGFLGLLSKRAPERSANDTNRREDDNGGSGCLNSAAGAICLGVASL